MESTVDRAMVGEESRLRRLARRKGLQLRKSRGRTRHLNDQGGYRIIDPNRNWIIAGERFDLTLNDARNILE